MIPIYHEEGDKACGGLALYLNEQPEAGDLITTKMVTWPDGHEAEQYEMMNCPQCGTNLALWMRNDGSIYAMDYDTYLERITGLPADEARKALSGRWGGRDAGRGLDKRSALCP